MITEKNNLIDIEKLTKQEREIFIMFLKHEKNRHLDDIMQINKTINIMEKGGKKQ